MDETGRDETRLYKTDDLKCSKCNHCLAKDVKLKKAVIKCPRCKWYTVFDETGAIARYLKNSIGKIVKWKSL
jgi:phage FluMu protein Com